MTTKVSGTTNSLPLFKLSDFPVTAQKKSSLLKEFPGRVLKRDKDLTSHNVAQSFEDVSELALLREGGEGSMSFISFPGSPASGTHVLWEDMTLNDPSSPTGTFDFSTLGMDTFDKVEIFQGNDPVLGNLGTGGTIRLFTLSEKKNEPPSLICTETGDNGFVLLRGRHHIPFEKGFLKLNISGVRTDGAPVGISPPLFRRQAYDTLSFNMQGDIRLASQTKGTFLLKENESKLESLYDVGTNFLTKSHIKAFALKTHNLSKTTHQKLGVSQNLLTRQVLGKNVSSQTYKGNREEVRYALKHYVTPGFFLQGGMGGVQEGFYQDGDKKKRNFEYLFASQTVCLFQNVDFTVSGRVEAKDIKNHPIYAFKAAVSYERKMLSGGASIDFTQKRPTLYELYSSNTYAQGNTHLKDEEAWGIQIFALQKELLKKTDVGIRLFERHFSRSVMGVFQQGKIFYQASPFFKTQGIEPFWTISLSKIMKFQGEATYTELRKKENTGYPPNLTPSLKMTAALYYMIGPSFQEGPDASRIYLKGRLLKYKSNPIQKATSFTVVDGGYDYYLDAHKKIYAIATNIFNKSYRTRMDPNIKGEPLSFYVGLEVKF